MPSTILTTIKSRLIESFPEIIIQQKKTIIQDGLRNNEWSDLTEGYKKQKQREYGFEYPMLKASGDLMNSFIVEVQESETSLHFEVKNNVQYFNTVDSRRNISSFSEKDMDELTNLVAEVIQETIREYRNGV